MAPQKKLTIPAVPSTQASPEEAPAKVEELSISGPVQLELDLGPTKGERGEFLPATYLTASGSIRSDR